MSSTPVGAEITFYQLPPVLPAVIHIKSFQDIFA